ncbi:MAG: hypothetical protein K6V97_10950 [Actinomycetia bacterium]|nr:hypothetical protein [Actinomycetes bacterium]
MGVRITLAGSARAATVEDHLPEGVAVAAGPVPAHPWRWLTDDLPWYGIGDGPELPRIWFVGEPQGLEVGAFQVAVRALVRRDGGLSPLTRDTVRRLDHPPPLAVLTVPS